MKRILLSALFIVPTLVIGQIIDENFDSYSDQDYAGTVSPIISTWSGNTGAGTDDCLVTSSESSSPSNSITITGANAGGAIDAMVEFPSDYTTGRYEYSMKFKVAAGMGGYFNLQSNAIPGTAWMINVFFAADGTGAADLAGTSVVFNYTNGAWVDVMIMCDLDNDNAELWIEGAQVGTAFQWSLESDGTGTGANKSFGGINLYSLSGDPTADCEYYVDDIMLVNTTAVGVDELTNRSSFTVFPNPATDVMNIQFTTNSSDQFGFVLYNLVGEKVMSENWGTLPTGQQTYTLNMNSIATGMYMLELTSSIGSTTLPVQVR